MKKGNKYLLIGIFVFFIFLGIIFLNALVNKNIAWEQASHIKIKIATTERTLDNALNNNLLVNDALLPLTVSSGTLPSLGHNSSEIWISIKENGVRKEMFLKDTFSSARNLCGDINFTNYSISPSPSIKYHLATQVEILNASGQTKSLQDAINSKELLYTKNQNTICSGTNEYYSDSCNVLGNLKTNCGVDGSIHSPYTFQCSSNQIIASGTYDHKGCANNACFTTPTPGQTTIACNSGYSCSDGDTSGDCASAFSLVGRPFSGVTCNQYGFTNANAPVDTCNEDNLNPSGCLAGFTGSCIDIDFISCGSVCSGGGRGSPQSCSTYSNYNVRTLQCNSLS